MKQDRVEARLVNDTEVDVIFNVGSDDQGAAYQQMLLFFPSQQGKVFLMAQGSAATWNQAMLDRFLDSLR